MLVSYGGAYWRFHNKKNTARGVATQRKRRQREYHGKGVSARDLPPHIDPNTQRARKRVRKGPAAVHQLATATTRSRVSLVSAVRSAAGQDDQYQKWLLDLPTGWTKCLTSAPGQRTELLFDERNRLIVPNDQALRTSLLAELHDGVTGAHAGRDRMLSEAQKRFHWDGLATAVEAYVTTCVQCQRNKHNKQLTPGLLMPLPIPDEPCMHWTTDAVCGLPKTKRGHTAIQVYVDRLTKLKHFAVARTTDDSAQLASTTLKAIIAQHGLPKSMVSDRDPRITARF